MSPAWLENLTKPLGSLLNPIAERLGNWAGRKKPKLYVHFVTTQAVWCIARDGDEELMQAVVWADLNHDSQKETLVITNAYLSGTESHIRATFNLAIPPGAMVRKQIAVFVLPIKGERGKPWTGKFLLVDQFDRKYKTKKITLRWFGEVPHTEPD